MDNDRYLGAVPLSAGPSSGLRAMVYVLTAITAALIVTVFAEPTIPLGSASLLVPTGFLCLAIFLWHVKDASCGVLRVVFVLLALHALVGYLIAPSSLPWAAAGTLDDRAFSISFAVIASGLMVAAFSFHLSAPSRGWLPHVDTGKLVKLAKWMTVGALAGVVFFYGRNGLLLWQVNALDMDVLRYRISGLDEWIINRSTDILMITVPLLFLFDGAAKLFSFVGLLGLAITFKRAPILDVIIVVALANVIRTGKLRKLVLTAGAMVCAYAASQLFYLGLFRGQINPVNVYQSMASGLPEVRDLGWILWLNGHNLHWGTTLIQAVLPVPSFMSPWIQKNGLRGLTTRMIGYDWDEIGGLRLTLAGEGYLNFGIVGAMALCAVWGWGMRKITGVISAAGQSGAAVHAYFAALLVSWMAFWLHLGGSQASGVVRTSVLLLAAMFYVCRPKRLRE